MILNILNNKSAWRFLVLASYSPGAGYTRKEILNLLDWTNLSLDRTLKKLEFYKVIKRDKRKIKLNFESDDANKLLEIVEYEKKKLNYPQFSIFLILAEFVRLIENKPISSAYLFGSHAKKTASENSDIDIAIFSHEDVNLIEAKDRILRNFGREIQLHYFKAGEKTRLVEEVLKHGVRIV